jgi:hypothetical protein
MGVCISYPMIATARATRTRPLGLVLAGCGVPYCSAHIASNLLASALTRRRTSRETGGNEAAAGAPRPPQSVEAEQSIAPIGRRI